MKAFYYAYSQPVDESNMKSIFTLPIMFSFVTTFIFALRSVFLVALQVRCASAVGEFHGNRTTPHSPDGPPVVSKLVRGSSERASGCACRGVGIAMCV